MSAAGVYEKAAALRRRSRVPVLIVKHPGMGVLRDDIWIGQVRVRLPAGAQIGKMNVQLARAVEIRGASGQVAAHSDLGRMAHGVKFEVRLVGAGILKVRDERLRVDRRPFAIAMLAVPGSDVRNTARARGVIHGGCREQGGIVADLDLECCFGPIRNRRR